MLLYTLAETAHEISRAHWDDAGIDFRTPEPFTLHAGEQRIIDTGVAVQIPIGYYGKMESKSGLMVNHGVICLGGVIDSGFRGSIKVRMWNTWQEDYTFEKGDKLVQMVLIPTPLLEPLESVGKLGASQSGRDENGYGSSGR